MPDPSNFNQWSTLKDLTPFGDKYQQMVPRTTPYFSEGSLGYTAKSLACLPERTSSHSCIERSVPICSNLPLAITWMVLKKIQNLRWPPSLHLSDVGTTCQGALTAESRSGCPRRPYGLPTVGSCGSSTDDFFTKPLRGPESWPNCPFVAEFDK
jgi:hypothetical protein